MNTRKHPTEPNRQRRAAVVSWERKGMPSMKTHLPADLEQFVQAKVQSGRFASPDEAIAAGMRLLRQQEEAEEARTLEGIRQGLDDMHAGRGRPAEEVFADIRRGFN